MKVHAVLGHRCTPHRVGCSSDKDDAVALFLPPGSSYTTSRDSAMSYKRMKEKEEQLQGEVDGLLRQAPAGG